MSKMVLTWIKRARDMGATHIILMYDKEDKDKYPVFVQKHEDVDDKVKKLKLSEGKQEILDVVDV